MDSIGTIGAWVLGGLSAYAGIFQHPLNPSSPDIIAGLGSQLSADAAIFLPGSPQFASATDRWSRFAEPNITTVVEVATTGDVEATIKYANEHSLPFIAITGSHGAIKSLEAMNQGIEIWMRRMNAITIAPDGKTATIGGGTLSKEITDTFLAGPMLGGGYGFLQGRYGLISDNLVSAQMVLANGTSVTVSADSNPDLFWAIRGAGHNFGVVTEVVVKIYDVPPDNEWVYESFIYTQDKVEELYGLVNIMTDNGTQPVELINYSVFLRLPELDPDNALILLFILFEGPSSIEKQYSAPFHALGPAMVQSGSTTYPELPVLTGLDENSAPCQHGSTSLRFPILTKSYNPQAQRSVFDAFNKLTSDMVFSNSLFLFEGYSLQGVKAVPAELTAFPHREDNLIITPLVVYTPNATLDTTAIKFGKDVRDILHAADSSEELHAYVNYAHGDEGFQEVYGYEPWRRSRLRDLKHTYDPTGKFDFYAPIR
ncbi:hypothetical protein BP6252_06742 [Coleophoma cylindrospora]|uniref:FAD-binding PCMH-type domain-containing protein n=1 Tax=Coleophoma cylindrospora TaxID=1849047 RepID=A0A3D8RFK8_9HELO|nr:hypothetical protein BP6252_06742 [Coleophoma cylindrospora]